ncbi:hypothetical protein EDD85DRAFT_793192 [Armillaria nabsnona]|nr:hypothetical protein EDD85DRAFT_793192 [Armillaria nabsnona]
MRLRTVPYTVYGRQLQSVDGIRTVLTYLDITWTSLLSLDKTQRGIPDNHIPQPGPTQPDPTLISPALVEGFGGLRARAQAIESPSPGQFWKCPNISFLEDVQSPAKSPSPARPKPDPEAGFGGLRARAHTL